VASLSLNAPSRGPVECVPIPEGLREWVDDKVGELNEIMAEVGDPVTNPSLSIAASEAHLMTLCCIQHTILVTGCCVRNLFIDLGG
jgi:hypothetical protein